MKNQKIIIFSLAGLLFLTASFLVYSWNEPTENMPSNYSTPLNTSSTSQTKTGELGASSFIDADDNSYYINPSGNSVVSGTITVDRPNNADNVATKGYVDEMVSAVEAIVTGAQPLVNGAHSQIECTTAGGELVDSDVSYKMCRFNTSSCPSGWTQYKNYSTSIATTFSCEPYEEWAVNPYSSICTTAAPGFSNGTYTCPVGINGQSSKTFGTTCCSCYTDCPDCARVYIAFSSPISQIGCY
ncbi:MAG: hypothetical protein PHG24_00460 [Candidatus Pacebacteria bacterium]|nr:hypothetical protein [Candidatus Paceibacterota bacterium]